MLISIESVSELTRKYRIPQKLGHCRRTLFKAQLQRERDNNAQVHLGVVGDKGREVFDRMLKQDPRVMEMTVDKHELVLRVETAEDWPLVEDHLKAVLGSVFCEDVTFELAA